MSRLVPIGAAVVAALAAVWSLWAPSPRVGARAPSPAATPAATLPAGPAPAAPPRLAAPASRPTAAPTPAAPAVAAPARPAALAGAPLDAARLDRQRANAERALALWRREATERLARCAAASAAGPTGAAAAPPGEQAFTAVLGRARDPRDGAAQLVVLALEPMGPSAEIVQRSPLWRRCSLELREVRVGLPAEADDIAEGSSVAVTLDLSALALARPQVR